MFNHALKYILILSLGLFLNACQTAHKNADEDEGEGTTAEVATQGLGEDSGFHGWGYSTKAPANQSYYFNFDRSEVKSEYSESISAQAHYLAKHPHARVRIEGNTDARGSREYNVALGYRRANSVAAILRMKGVKSKQIAILSWGREKPVAMGDSEEAYQQNRRVDLVYEAKE